MQQPISISVKAFTGTSEKYLTLPHNPDRLYLALYAHTGAAYITIGDSDQEIPLAQGALWEPKATFTNSLSYRGTGKLLVLIGTTPIDAPSFPLNYATFALTYGTHTLTYTGV